MVSKYQALCYNVFGRYAHHSKNLEIDLKKARIKTPPEIYITYVWFTSVLALIPGIAILVLFLLISTLPNMAIPPAISAIFYLSPLLFAAITYFFLMLNPKMKARKRAKDIDKNLPSALGFISAMASAGVNPDLIFKNLAEQEVYGEVSKEAEWIYRDISVMGSDIITALRNGIERSPAIKFSDFLQGAITIINSGGDLKKYFLAKSEQFIRERKQVERNFLETLGVMSEAYVTVAVATPLFLIIIISVMMMIGGNAADASILTYLIIFGVLPIMHIAFIVIINIMTEEVIMRGKKRKTKFKPDISIIISAILVTVCIVLIALYPAYTMDFGIAALLAALGPYGFKKQRENQRAQKIEDRFPEFLNDLAESRKAGMTFTAAIKTISKGDYDVLTPEIQKMANQISWSISFTDALKMLGERLKIGSIERYITLIIGANNAGGSVSDVIASAAYDARESKLIRSERRVNMSIYIMVIYICFFVFLAVIAVLYGSLVPQMVSASSSAAAEGFNAISSLPAESFLTMYFFAVLVQGIGNGLVGGMMSEGNVTGGLKHVFVMVLATYIAFKFLI